MLLENLDPKKFQPLMKKLCDDFHEGINILGPIFHGDQILGAQIFQGLNFLGSKKVRGPNEIVHIHSVAKVNADFPFYDVKCLCSGGQE